MPFLTPGDLPDPTIEPRSSSSQADSLSLSLLGSPCNNDSAMKSNELLIQAIIWIDLVDGETMETGRYFIFGGSKITADGDCSLEIRRHLLLGRKVMTTLDSILKSRDITLPTKFHIVKAMVFPIVMYGCESWTIKKAEC